MKNILAVLAVALVAAVAQGAESSDISIADLKAAVAAKTVTLLDANGSDSWQAGHIPGAIDFAAQKTKLASLLPQDKGALIVAYCGGPKCGAYKSAAAAAKKLGYTNIKHLSAGISGWKKAGEAVEKGN
jgi:rhodanese-related sulfurtransferase